MTSRILCKSTIYYQILLYTQTNLKKYRGMIGSTWKINLEIVGHLLIKLLELFTSEFKYRGIKVRKKSGFILVFCLFLGGTSSKTERNGKVFRKRCQNFTFDVLSRWLSDDITYSGLLINKKQKVTDTEKSKF